MDIKNKCYICNDTGIAKYLDVSIELPDGKYDLNTLMEEKGKWGHCPDCLKTKNENRH